MGDGGGSGGGLMQRLVSPRTHAHQFAVITEARVLTLSASGESEVRDGLWRWSSRSYAALPAPATEMLGGAQAAPGAAAAAAGPPSLMSAMRSSTRTVGQVITDSGGGGLGAAAAALTAPARKAVQFAAHQYAQHAAVGRPVRDVAAAMHGIKSATAGLGRRLGRSRAVRESHLNGTSSLRMSSVRMDDDSSRRASVELSERGECGAGLPDDPSLPDNRVRRADSNITDHSFDLVFVSRVPNHFRPPNRQRALLQRDAIDLIMDSDHEVWRAHFAADGAPTPYALRKGRLCGTRRADPYYSCYAHDEACVYAGLWVEKRARALGLYVEVRASRDRDEVFRLVRFDEAIAEEWLLSHDDFFQRLPSMRSAGDADTHLTSATYRTGATSSSDAPSASGGRGVDSKYSSMERIHILMHMLMEDADLNAFSASASSEAAATTTMGNPSAAMRADPAAVEPGKGAGLRLIEYEEFGYIHIVQIHDGRARHELWDLYMWSDWLGADGPGPEGKASCLCKLLLPIGWLGWLGPPLRAMVRGMGCGSIYGRSRTSSRRGGVAGDDAPHSGGDEAQRRLDEVRMYFGEKVALYFAFLEYFTNSLLPLAILGTPVSLAGWWWFGHSDNPAVLVYSVFSLLWISVFSQFWQRQEHRLAYRWAPRLRTRSACRCRVPTFSAASRPRMRASTRAMASSSRAVLRDFLDGPWQGGRRRQRRHVEPLPAPGGVPIDVNDVVRGS